MQTVPEVEVRKPVIFDDEELFALAIKLAGNHSFKQCRGKFETSIDRTVCEIIDDSPSPTIANIRLEEYLRSVMVMGNLLAKLKRDRMKRAFDELRDALRSNGHVILGETIPLEKTVPLTMLMLEPELTLDLVRWGMGDDRHPDHTKRIYRLLPTLQAHGKVAEMKAEGYGAEIAPSYYDVLAGLPRAFDEGIPLINPVWKTFPKRSVGPGFTHLRDLYFPLAFVFIGKEQDEVLKIFDREQQKRIATWQIDAPRFLFSYGNSSFHVGFHEESVHDIWLKRFPAFASKGVSAGHGAFLLMRGVMNHYSWIDYENMQSVDIQWGHATGSDFVRKPGTEQRILLNPDEDDKETQARLQSIRL
jgi:hypothetical protein